MASTEKYLTKYVQHKKKNLRWNMTSIRDPFHTGILNSCEYMLADTLFFVYNDHK